ncbi:MAG TPA: TIGR03619 family F420-dependent LLM class oxidoreductase [Nakamurella sp.]|nr:TIGR03619 family F420-dependent LLM class oxidoreductase [Nakamurella sp.]
MYADDHRPLDRTERGMTYGVLVPHFGEHCTADRIIAGSALAEEVGFDAVWVRDHLLWSPHGMEGNDRTFVEAVDCLSAIAARTSRVQLGTAVLIPIRWPLKLAQDLASLSYLAGGRVIAGLGLGSGQNELGAAGFLRKNRKPIFVETTEILPQIWQQDEVSYQGRMFQFEDVTIRPKPVEPIPLWYGGTTPISVENAVRYCQGWMPGRIPIDTLKARLAQLDGLAEDAGRRVTKAAVPLVRVDKNRDRARADIDVAALAGSSEASASWITPPGGFNTVDDLRGIVAVGEPREIVEQIAELAETGLDHVTFDLRLQFDRYEETLELLGSDVLPELRRNRI